MKKYCSECGFCIEYTTSLPNFCPQCGAKINSSFSGSSRQVEANKNIQYEEDPVIKFSFGGVGNKRTLEDIMGGEGESIKLSRNRDFQRKQKINKVEYIKNLSDESTKEEIKKDYGSED
jgi:predicted RNA-binding Zn-ribbon protein involved in translation (DUF1610 family)